MYKSQEQEREKLQQQQEQEHQRAAQQRADDAKQTASRWNSGIRNRRSKCSRNMSSVSVIRRPSSPDYSRFY